ncbi:MAG: sugar phosphate isomerase/epimerase [Clostridia bacterium]|nr:sugar phosphate isomerase/epimerase [Clostridia bacterium]
MKRFRIGFTTVTFRRKTAEQICEIAKRHEVDILEWGTDVHVPTPEEARRVRALCDEYGLTTASVGAYHRIGVENETPFSETIEIAKILGASRIRVWLGKKSSADFTPEERTALIAETRALVDMAKAEGIEIALEFHRRTYNDGGAVSRAFLDEINDPALSTYWQPFFRETPERDFLFDDDRSNLLAVLPHVSAAHVFTWDEQANRFPFARRRDEWRVFLDILRDSPCQDLIMEFVPNDSHVQLGADIAVLRDLLGQ